MHEITIEPMRRLDAASLDFARAAQYPEIAERDLAALNALARVLVADVAGWCTLLGALDCAGPHDLHRATTLVLETVFDEALSVEAFSVLAAEVDMLTDGLLGETR